MLRVSPKFSTIIALAIVLTASVTIFSQTKTPSSLAAVSLATTTGSPAAIAAPFRLQVTERASGFVPIQVEGTSETAQCNSNEVVTGGGYFLSTAGPPHDIVVDSNHKDERLNGWTVIATLSPAPKPNFFKYT